MSTRPELIANALRARLTDLCTRRAGQLAPENFKEAAPFVSEVRQQLLPASPQTLIDLLPAAPGDVWLDADTKCLASLQALALGRLSSCKPGVRPPLAPFLQELQTERRNPSRRFELLNERYSCPVSFGCAAESEIREHVLERLMVQDRANIRAFTENRVPSDDLLLKLNLIAVNAQLTDDLRFLDALNYYYDLLTAEWIPSAHHPWLLTSYLRLYAGALAFQIQRNQEFAH